ncbi:molybdopterin-dependent oxidoreductase [Alcanivorax sp. 1008]|uniref:molybdopterin-dependent oxidoreductase n=1 Tax=Alcanivorax sp. 1008 TaxID=2816853 RepID=UPI001E0B53D1|nr:molybdopterin-dependent oxidoreductase [Alcanivorax sp. 1008]MCC1497495.1 molybdopterin-dependent oxidoreductase [Alcanivorax sp. 1008]
METRLHHRTCNLCEAMCGIEIELAGDTITAIRGDKQDPFSRGHICPKAVALQDLHHDPDRLRRPVRRTASGWEEISWQEALDETAARLKYVRRQHGGEAVGLYVGNPTAHNHGALLLLLPFIRALGSRNRYSATSVDQLPHQLACLKMFGHQVLFPVPDIDRTEYFLVIGANPMASNGSIMTAPDMRNRLKAIRARGGKIVVLDPRRTETAEVADAHHFIRPGTDVFLLLGLLNVLFAEGLARPGHLAEMLDGYELLQGLVKSWTAERVSRHTGVSAEVIKQIARDFADAKCAAAYSRVGTTTSEHSGLSAWLVYAVNIVTGNFDRAGGLMFTHPAFDVVGMAGMTGETGGFDRFRSRVRQMPEFGGEFPVATLADEILTPGKGQIRAMVTHAGNPVLSCPDGQRLDQAFSNLDFMVSIDFYINETTRHADIILPPTGQLEHAQFDPVFHLTAVRNTTKFSPALFEAEAGALHDWQILLELTTRLNSRDRWSTLKAKALHRLLSRLGDTGMVDLGLRLGPYGDWRSRIESLRGLLARLPLLGGGNAAEHQGSEGLTLEKVIAEPHGIDLGPLRPSLPDRLFTRGKSIHLVPQIYIHELEALQQVEPESDGRMRLIGRRHVRSNNSWMHNSQRLVKGKSRCTVMLHPEDAARLGITDSMDVEVTSEAGSICLPAEITDSIMPGVVSIPHGFGHARKGVRLGVASRHAGVSVNDVIRSDRTDALTGTAILNGQVVELRAFGAGV